MNIIDHVTLDGVTKYIKDSAGQAMLAPEEASTTAANAYAIGELFRYDGKLYKATSAIAVGDTITVGSNCSETTLTNERIDVQVNGTSILNNGIATIPIANDYLKLGLVKVENNFGIKSNAGRLYIDAAGLAHSKAGTDTFRPVTPYYQHNAVFYGLAKAAGDTTQSVSTNAVGTYTDEASTAIRSMLGAIGTTDIATDTTAGIIRAGNGGGLVLINGKLMINPPANSVIKAGTAENTALTINQQHMGVFYGLAKAAGDTTQSVSSNAIGTYTTEAKAAIHTMLGIDPASIAAQVDIPLVETVEGTTPSITGQPNVRYVCGEVSTITLTPPASGSMDVIFESGSTAAVLTVPNTVKWPAWFDASSLETDTTYEILITDGVYGSVMTWAN